MKDKKDLRIVYMGTPDFAVESLRAIVDSGYNVVGVITMPDKPAGRGYKLQASPVKQFAVERGIPVLQPEKLKDEAFLDDLSNLKADIQVVVAFRMLPEVVWNMPPMGTFNLHGSLLPQYRGAAPINWAIINGEKQTGITTFFLTHEIDTGKILFKASTPIEVDDTAGVVHDRLMMMGGELVVKTLDAICADDYTATEQDALIEAEESLKAAPKIFKDTCRIDWNKSLDELHDFVRGLSPYPAAWCELEGLAEPLTLKIFQTKKKSSLHQFPVGTLITDEKSYVDVAVNGGFLSLVSLQLAGKKRLAIADFLRGFKWNDDLKLS